ncbi:hypothetical protein Nepgr_001698 [Nepenthes gracilis]|uniref:Uncharacterized protein n=1 Tax=Nepenthes gracilis TaxID=150966 RepID=A0AAD3P8N0_NEPGR|nr:hypothetical protein Nepgr_001698 [Nepenthes gracilis]
MKKSAEKSVSPSIDLTPTTQAQGTEETADPTFDAPMPDKNIGSEVAIFSGLTPLSEIHNEPSSEQISNVLVVDDSSRSAHISDRIQRAASEAPIENPLISSSAVDEIRTVVADPPRPGKEINIPEVPVSTVGVRAEWMNTPTSSHPSPGSHADRPNTSASRIPLNEISLRARFIQDERLNEIMRIGIHQRRLWIGQLQREVQTLSQNRVDPMVFEEMRNKMEAATVEAQQYKDRNIILEADLQKARDEIQSMSFNLSESQKELGSAQQEIANLNSEMLTRFRPEEIGSALVARFQEVQIHNMVIRYDRILNALKPYIGS